MSDLAYPLHWPAGWPRTQNPQRNTAFAARSVHSAVTELQRQLEKLKATEVVISSNVTLGHATPKDRGVCVYFKIKAKPYALPCDKWDCAEDNLWALAKHIENMRSQERWGVGSIERQFAGYLALPSTADNPEEWWKVLGCDQTATLAQAQEAYRDRARIWHPDNGGDAGKMAVLNAAWTIAKRALST